MKHSRTAGRQWVLLEAEGQPAGEGCLSRLMEKGYKCRENTGGLSDEDQESQRSDGAP